MRHLLLWLSLLLSCSGESGEPLPPTGGGVNDPGALSWAVHTAAVDDDPPRATDACDQQPQVTWDSWGQGFFRGYCTACHSRGVADRWGAPVGMDFDTEADVIAVRYRIQSVVLETQRMPVGGGVLEQDLELLQVFLSCGL